MKIRDLLRDEIARRQVSQTQAAAEIGVSQPQLSRWLSDDDQVPSAESCAGVARFLNISTGNLLHLAGYLPDDWNTGSPTMDPKWERIQPRLRDALGPDDSLWDGLLDMFKAVKRATYPALKEKSSSQYVPHPAWA